MNWVMATDKRAFCGHLAVFLSGNYGPVEQILQDTSVALYKPYQTHL